VIIWDETIEDAKISLDGGSFYRCTFRRCTLVFSGLLPVTLEGCGFDLCIWQLNGPAMNTVQFMSGMYKAGARDLVEKTFQAIRGQGSPENPSPKT
jgi:hypothetical protein